jgi:hypothetical protein
MIRVVPARQRDPRSELVASDVDAPLALLPRHAETRPDTLSILVCVAAELVGRRRSWRRAHSVGAADGLAPRPRS